MQLRPLLTGFVGFAVAGSAVLYAHLFIKAPDTEQPMRDVVIATGPINPGQVIDMDMLTMKSWPAHIVPEGVFASISEVMGNEDSEPRRAKHALTEGDLISSMKVSDFGEQVTITQQIDPRMRAMTIRVDDVTGVAGFVAPLDRIDLTLTRSVNQTLVTSTILQDIKVLGIDQTIGGSDIDPGRVRSVTVQVKPADAQKLALAQQAGTLSVSLRHIDAADQLSLDSISVSDLTEKSTAKPKRTERGLPSIIVNRRGSRETVEVPSG